MIIIIFFTEIHIKKAKKDDKIADLAIPIPTDCCPQSESSLHRSLCVLHGPLGTNSFIFFLVASNLVVFGGDGDDVGLLAFDSALAAAGRP